MASLVLPPIEDDPEGWGPATTAVPEHLRFLVCARVCCAAPCAAPRVLSCPHMPVRQSPASPSTFSCARGRRAFFAPARGTMPLDCTADWVPRCSRLRPSQRATAWVAPASGTSRESATGGSTGSAASSARRASRRRSSWSKWTRRDSTWSSRRHRPSPSGAPALAAGAAACAAE
jgi:hypothetical protein